MRAMRNSMPVLKSGLACKTVKVEKAEEASWRMVALKHGVSSILDLIRSNPQVEGNPSVGSVLYLPPCDKGGEWLGGVPWAPCACSACCIITTISCTQFYVIACEVNSEEKLRIGKVIAADVQLYACSSWHA